MPISDPKTLYVFLDESGNLDFSPGGTKNYVLAAVVTDNPLASSQELQDLKYDHLRSDVDTEYFHASEDKQTVRNAVIARLQRMTNTVNVHYIHAQKNKTNPSLQNTPAFYGKLGTTLIKFIVQWRSSNYDEIVIVFDKALHAKDQRAFLGQIKPELKNSASRIIYISIEHYLTLTARLPIILLGLSMYHSNETSNGQSLHCLAFR